MVLTVPWTVCDSGISATSDKHSVSATLGNDVVLSVHRNDSTNRVDDRLLKASECVQCLPCWNASQIGSVLPRVLLRSDIIFLQEVISTRCKSSWHLHLDVEKHPLISAATAAGHLDGTRWRRLKHNLKLEPLEPEGSEGEVPQIRAQRVGFPPT